MKYNVSNIIGDAGEHLVAARIIKLFGFPCRLMNIDIGIDAEIEIIDEAKRSTGEFIKCQIKTTTSDTMYLYLDGDHIRYWNNLEIPVVIFLVHLHTEKIYWHCVDDINTYPSLESGFKVEFSRDNTLLKRSKPRFLEISWLPTKRIIQKKYDRAFELAKSDKEEYLDSGNYDLTTYDYLVSHANEIEFYLSKSEQCYKIRPELRVVQTEYAAELDYIHDYLLEIEEGKQSINEDYGYDYFENLRDEGWDWS